LGRGSNVLKDSWGRQGSAAVTLWQVYCERRQQQVRQQQVRQQQQQKQYQYEQQKEGD
jgi:hypothetical protein